jgi:hypothetical protein
MSVSWKGEVALIVEWRKGIEEKDTADVRCIRSGKTQQERPRVRVRDRVNRCHTERSAWTRQNS